MPLDGVDLKLGRARVLIADLRESIETRLDPARYRVDAEFDPTIARVIYRVRDLPAVDPEWAIRIGEVLFQLLVRPSWSAR